MAASKPTIGFIGLGIMGQPMAQRLLDAGYTLTVHDVDSERAKALVVKGALRGASAKDVSTRTQVIITMLPDTPDVDQVVFGPQGILEGIRPGATLIDMSSIAPSMSRRIAAAAERAGFAALDAPVSGGDVGAQQGTLSIMVGGDEKTFDRMLPILQVMGKRIILCGGPGAGQTVKVCNQILVGITLAGVAEALTLGAKAGVDPAKIVEVLSGGLARCGVLENRGMRMLEGDFAPGFRCRLHYKDLRIAIAAGQDYAVPLPTTALVHEMFKEMVLSERGDLDHSGLLTLVEDRAGIKVRRHK
ncbi:MAG: NAD(P)-dependent oxidoreductase [Anaerolineales bacterium]|jgi:2-hydroxy-3-oxopropionate reductase